MGTHTINPSNNTQYKFVNVVDDVVVRVFLVVVGAVAMVRWPCGGVVKFIAILIVTIVHVHDKFYVMVTGL